jgi:hypothetical protein
VGQNDLGDALELGRRQPTQPEFPDRREDVSHEVVARG